MTKPRRHVDPAPIFTNTPKNKLLSKKSEVSPVVVQEGSQEYTANMDQRFDQLIAAIKEGNHTLSLKIDSLEEKCNLAHADQKVLAIQVKEQQSKIMLLENRIEKVEQENSYMKQALGKCQKEVEWQEARSRQYNLKLTGVAESSEKDLKMETFVDIVLKNILPGIEELGPLHIETAHRISQRIPQPGRPPRPIIIKFSKVETRNKIMEFSRQSGPKSFQGNTVSLFYDQIRRIQQLRLSYWEVKKKLRTFEIQYSMVKEATLRVLYKDKAMFFDTPEDAMQFVDSLS